MKFGKLESLKGVDFSLPNDPEENKRVLDGSDVLPQPSVRLACPVWTHKGFAGTIMPEKTPAAKYLYHYSRSFNSIELNSTFYRTDKQTVHKWADQAPDDFRFCPKITRQISHYRQLNNVEQLMEEYIDAVMGFEHKLGPIFLLLPPQFATNRFTLLQEFVENFPKGVPWALEVRHESWYTDRAAHEDLFHLLRENEVISIITDVAGRRDVLHMNVTNPTTIIRFVGNMLDPTDYSRLDSWVDRLKVWGDQGLKEAYFFMHQPEEDLNVQLGTHLAEAFKAKNGWDVQGPKLYHEPKQASLF